MTKEKETKKTDVLEKHNELFIKKWKTLEGKWFHNFKEENGAKYVKEQGQIISDFNNGYYAVQYYDRVMGGAENIVLVHIGEIAADKWDLYGTYEDMDYAYKHKYAAEKRPEKS